MGIKVQRRQKHPPRSDGQARPAAAGWMSSLGEDLCPWLMLGQLGWGVGDRRAGGLGQHPLPRLLLRKIQMPAVPGDSILTSWGEAWAFL